MFTIITINKNNSTGLEKTIQSVINQTYTDYEYIVIDGNSTDNSKEIIEKYSNKITKYIIEPDAGIYDAMNKGIKLISNKYCLFLNSGDYFASDNILQIVSNLIDNEDIIYGNILVEKQNKREHIIFPNTIDLHYLLKYSIPHQATFIKSTLFNEIGLYSTNFKIVSDWLWFVKCVAYKNIVIKHINQNITIFDSGGISMNSDYEKLIISERKHALQTIFSDSVVQLFDDYIVTKEKYNLLYYNRYTNFLKKLHLIST